MDKLKDALKKLKVKSTVVAVALIIVGLMFVIFPGSSATIICYVAGALLLLWGIICLVSYFSSGLKKPGSSDLALGITLVCVALLLFIKPWAIAGFLTIILGIALIVDGTIKIQQFVDMTKAKMKTGWLVLLFAIISLVLGILMAFDPFGGNVLMIFAGISLMVVGVLDLIAVGVTGKIKGEVRENVIELEEDDIHHEET